MSDESSQSFDSVNSRRYHGKCRGRLAKLHFDQVAIPGSQVKLKNLTVPTGLDEILAELSREVLREQPADIAEFAALFFEKEINKGSKSIFARCNRKVSANVDVQDVGALHSAEGSQTDEKINGGTQTLAAGSQHGHNQESQTLDDESEKSLERVSARFRFSIADNDEATRAATIIQAGYRGHHTRKSICEGDGSIELFSAEIFRRHTITPKPVESRETEIANCIIKQTNSETKGGKTQKEEKEGLEGYKDSLCDIAESGSDVDQAAAVIQVAESGSDVDQAAVVIQAAFRGHTERRRLSVMASDTDTGAAQSQEALPENVQEEEVQAE